MATLLGSAGVHAMGSRPGWMSSLNPIRPGSGTGNHDRMADDAPSPVVPPLPPALLRSTGETATQSYRGSMDTARVLQLGIDPAVVDFSPWPGQDADTLRARIATAEAVAARRWL